MFQTTTTSTTQAIKTVLRDFIQQIDLVCLLRVHQFLFEIFCESVFSEVREILRQSVTIVNIQPQYFLRSEIFDLIESNTIQYYFNFIQTKSQKEERFFLQKKVIWTAKMEF